MVPIFIFPCGGRSGSTWLARLLTSSKQILVWSETHILSQRFGYLNSVAYTYEEPTGKDTDLHYFRKHGTTMWSAALRPFERDFDKNWALMMDNLFGDAAKAEGYERWGLKEVTWTVGDLQFIRDHWEDYRVIFLIRNFMDCYRSAIGTGWLLGDTGRTGFIQEWLRMASQINFNHNTQGKERIFKYEHLDKQTLADWCNITIPGDVPYVGSSSSFIHKQDWNLIYKFIDSINELSVKLSYNIINKDSLYPEELQLI